MNPLPALTETPPETKSRRGSTLSNRGAIRRFALSVIAAERPHLANKITRISPEVFAACETSLRAFIRNRVLAASTAGKTLR